MKLKWFILIIVIVFSTGIATSLIIIKNKSIPEVNLVKVNEVVKTIEGNWGQVNEDLIKHMELQQPIIIIDPLENVIYQTNDTEFTNLYEAVKNRDTIVDLKVKEAVVGKVIIKNSETETLQQMKEELTITVSIIFGLLMLISTFFIFYIIKTVLKPFNQLQHFATNVARGNLDIPLVMDKNNHFGAFTESFDIMREELAAVRQREYESNRSKKELVATLSHDIKTPVASIKAVSELMLMQTTDEKVLKRVSTIYSKADQIDLLVTDMFHATLEELQQLQLTVVEEKSDVLVEMIENVNYDNKIFYGSIPQCIILIDPIRMQQVIDNIISNSYKYAGTRIEITSRINEGFLELHIMDFGPGIVDEELPLLFNKYYRGKNVKGKTGSGLGLFISKYFFENMNGQISCHNRSDGFTVILKIKLA